MMLNKGKAGGYIAIIVGAALLLYGYTLWLPFFWDDVMHAEWMRNVGLSEIWHGPQAGLGYFRPLTFSIWKILELTQAANLAFVQHFVNLILHSANSCLVGWMAGQMARIHKGITAVIGALLFLVFPFTFQVVAPINSLHHLLLVFFVLLSAVAYQIAVTTVDFKIAMIGTALTMICMALAMLSHENAIVAPVLLAVSFFALSQQGMTRRAIIIWLLDAAILVVFFVIWLSVRAASGSAFSVGDAGSRINEFIANLIYFGQGLAFPITWSAQKWGSKINLSPQALVALLACVYILIGLFMCHMVRVMKTAVLGLAWWLIASLPACLMLAQNYLSQSPRLIYLSSVGAIFFLVAPIGGQRDTRLQWALGICASLFVIVATIQGTAYIQQRATLYKLVGSAITDLNPNRLVASTCNAQKNGEILVINFPEWFFMNSPEYALGYDGIKTVAENSGLDELSRTNFGVPPAGEKQFTALTLPDLQTEGQPYHSFGGERSLPSLQTDIRASQKVVLGKMVENDMVLREAGCLLNNAAASPTTTAQFGSGLQLSAASAHYADSTHLVIEITWQAIEISPEDVTVFTHVVDHAGKLLAQADGYPVGGTAPMRFWKRGDVWHETRYIEISAALESKPQAVLIGIYSTQNGKRLPAINEKGTYLDQDAIRIAISP